jgi:hypothetical protein
MLLAQLILYRNKLNMYLNLWVYGSIFMEDKNPSREGGGECPEVAVPR